MEQTNPSGANPKETSAVSIFGQTAGATDQFPVLKAFQEYIEAEQAHARKRMIELSIFFAVLMMIVIVAFVFAWTHAMNRNQQLSDKLLDLALSNRAAQQPAAPVVVNPPLAPANGTNAEALKPVLEQLAAVTAALKESKSAAPAAVPEAPAANDTATRRLAARLDQQEDALRAERTKLREAQDKLHQMEVEQQRRRLYPEYYAKQDREGAPQTAAAVPTAADQSPSQAPSPSVRPAQVPPPVATAKPVLVAATTQTQAPTGKEAPLKPISYFNDEDDATPAPVAATTVTAAKPAMTQAAAPKGTVDYVLPVDTKRQGTVSWRVYIPE